MSYLGKRVLLKTPINPDTGYGIDGISLLQNFDRLGADVHLEPFHTGIPLPVDVAMYYTKPRPSKPYFDIALHHAYPGELGFPKEIHKYADKVIGWTMYEFTGFGETTEMTNKLEERLEPLDLLLVYDEISRQAMSQYCDPDKIQILQGGYDSKLWTPKESDSERDWDGTFRFCMNGTMNLRKNPWAAIIAFKYLKDEHGDDFDAELHLKTTQNSLPDDVVNLCPGLYLHYDNWNTDQLREFYSQMHCLVAPSWGEGKNLPALEAQTMGCVAVVSKVGGHMQWADDDWCYLVEGPMEEHLPEMGSMRVYPETMVDTMWHIYNNRHEARMKAEKAQSIIPLQCDWEPVMDRLKFKIDQIKPRTA